MVTRRAPERPLTAAPTVRHLPCLQAPWFAGEQEGMTLHRYLDTAFIPRFLQAAHEGHLVASAQMPWFRDERRPAYPDLPSLLLPIHRAFHLVCCEAVCRRPGHPALAPERIQSAGFVLRRGRPSGLGDRWMVEDGLAQGWDRRPFSSEDPDRRDMRRHEVPEPPYTGEETHLLQPLVVRPPVQVGPRRHRTLLWGYLPLDGRTHTQSATSLPVPLPFPQGAAEIFHVRPFLRWNDPQGRPQITWGDPSLPFRIAPPP